MKKNGFTVVELISSLVLISLIATMLIKVMFSLSDMYNTTSVKTELFYRQSTISKEMNELFLNKPISSITSCGDKCLTINYIDYTNKIIKIDDNLIYVGDKTFTLVENSVIGDIKFDIIYSTIALQYKPDTILNIKIPITYKGIDRDFGINLVYQYNRTNIEVSL